MPEGHLIHRIARDTAGLLDAAPLEVTSPQGRFAAEAATLDGSELAEAEAYGKHLLWRFGDSWVHVHLGMTGKVLMGGPGSAVIRQARLRLESERAVVHVVAPARCELLDADGRSRLIDGLGPDPLRPDADRDLALERMSKRAAPIGALLLDQNAIAGLGNVLRAELLFLAGIWPERPGTAIPRDAFEALWSSTVDVMRIARDEGRIITCLPPGVSRAEAASLPESEGRFVYKQAHCRHCGEEVHTWTLGGRTMYACPRDQTA